MAMYIGDLYIRMNAGTSAVYYSPTFPRSGLAATFAIDLFNLMGTGTTLECTVEHKNAEDTSFSSAGVFSSMNAQQLWTGFRVPHQTFPGSRRATAGVGMPNRSSAADPRCGAVA